MIKEGTLEKKEERAGTWYYTIDGTEYQVSAKSAEYRDRVSEGDTVKADIAGSMIKFIDAKNKSTSQGSGFMDDYVTYEELLKQAHTGKNGDKLQRIETRLHHFDWEKGNAIVEARVMMNNEKDKLQKVFYGLGDASPDNVNSMIKVHFVRMAETRAICRALRVALGIGKTAKEELGGDKE